MKKEATMMKALQTISPRRAALLMAMAAVPSQVNAVTTSWNVASGDWTNAANWTGGLPTSSLTANISNGGTASLASTAGAFSLTMGATGVGTLNLNSGASLTVGGAASLGVGSGTSSGTVNQYSGSTANYGSLTTGQFSSARQGFYNLYGGTFKTTGAVTLGNGGNGFFTQAGGEATIKTDLQLVTTVVNTGAGFTDGAYEISGGSLSITRNLNNGVFTDTTSVGTGRAVFRVVGSSASSITVGGDYVTGTQSTSAPKRLSTLDGRIDNGGITKISVTGNAVLGGTLLFSIKGGAALTDSSTFPIMRASSFTGDFSTKPSSSLWTTSIANDVSGTLDEYNVSFAATSNMGTLHMVYDNAIHGLSMTATAAGYVPITGIDTSITGPSTSHDLLVDLSVDPGAKTLDQLLTYFNSNGLVATTTSDAGYNVQLSFKPTSATAYYSWSLSGFDASARVGAVGVTAVVPEPTAPLALLLPAAGIILRRRPRQSA